MFKIFIFVTFSLTIVAASCPEGSFEWQTSCFFFHSNSSGFAAAEATCVQNNNGHLASIHDGFTNALLAQEAAKFFHESTVTDFWIGLTNLMPGGNWTWMDGTKFDFPEWAPTEPQNATGNNCAVLPLSNGLWKADDCFKAKPFVCESNKSFYEPTTTSRQSTVTSYPVYANCTFPFMYFEPTHSCYGYGDWGGALNWTQAEQYCLSIGGHSVSVHSYEESEFLKSFVWVAYSGIWSGAFSNNGGKTWEWSDLSPWNFNPWYPGYPNLNTSACGVLGTHGLFDNSCSAMYRIICKIKL